MNISFNSVIPIPMSGFVSKSDIWLSNTEFSQNNIYQIVAPSGTGKTSLVHFLFGIRSDFEGSISFDSKSTKDLNYKSWTELRKNTISIVFQGLRLFPELNVWENIRIKNKLTGYKTDEQIQLLLERLGLDAHIHKHAGILSFGQQQRVALIRALCQPYEFLLLDEPFSHLDEKLLLLKDRMNTETGRKMALQRHLFMEHYLDEFFSEWNG